MSTSAALDIAAVRARFTALQRPLAFFDSPGGTQCPDEVIDAISTYFRESNANVGAPYETSRRTDELIEHARQRAGDFLGCGADEVAFGPSMTGLNFLLTRAFARELRPGDEVLVTRLDHDANVAPWLELQHDLGIVVRFVEVTDEMTLDYDDLARQLSDRSRVVAFPVAANSVGTAPDVSRIVELAHSAGALAWADAVHYAPHGPIDVAAWDVDVLICSPYKFFGPHLGLAFGKRDLLSSWRPYKVRPAANEPVGSRFELGTLPHELLAGFVAAVDYIDSLGWEAITRHERELGERFLAGLPEQHPTAWAPDHDRPRAHVLLQRPGAERRGDRGATRRARPRGLVGQLLRARDDETPRARSRGRRRPRGHRPLQHGRRGRPVAGGPARSHRVNMGEMRDRMLRGELYIGGDPESKAEFARVQELLARFNRSAPAAWDERDGLLRQMLRHVGEEVVVRAPFYCEYGAISIGDRTFVNVDAVLLDVSPISDRCGVPNRSTGAVADRDPSG